MRRETWLNDNKQKPCPNCKSGKLEYDSKRASSSETKISLINNEYYKNGIVYPESNYLVTAHLKCDECSDIVTITYEKTDDVRYTDEEGNEISKWVPIIYHPAPHIIDIPVACPEKVRKHLIKSFGLFWYDSASCGNKIRAALESLLNDFSISSKGSNGNFISLANRLQTFATLKPEVQTYLDAIRWIGNTASHDDILTKEDLLDAYELIEHSLEVIYKEKEARLSNLSQQIKTNKGPIQR